MQTVSALQNKRNRTYRSGHGQNFVRVDNEFSRRSITFKIVQYAYLRTNVVRVSKSEGKKGIKWMKAVGSDDNVLYSQVKPPYCR